MKNKKHITQLLVVKLVGMTFWLLKLTLKVDSASKIVTYYPQSTIWKMKET
jgi:hypothetical protein